MSVDPLHIRAATRDDLRTLVALIVDAQREPERHIGYLEERPEPVRTQLLELEPVGLDGCVVAERDGRVVGLLAAEWDTQPPRVWWHGPIVADHGDLETIEDALYDAGRAVLPSTVTEQELFHDARSRRLPAFAARHGFERQPASAVLRTRLPAASAAPAVPGTAGPPPATTGAPATRPWRVEPMSEGHRRAVAALHDAAFPSGHLPGDRLDGPRRHVEVALIDEQVVGYLALEQQHDGQGYLDFLAVAPDRRGRGIGEALVRSGLRWCVARGAGEAHLTVREENHTARRLYERLGFREEMIAVPWRSGVPATEV